MNKVNVNIRLLDLFLLKILW